MDFVDFATRYGLPFAMAMWALYLALAERWVPGARLAKEEERHKNELAALNERHKSDLERLIREHTEELAEMRKDRDYYRALTFELLPRMERLAEVADRVSRHVEKPNQ